MKVILFDLGGVLVEWVGDRELVKLTNGSIDAERARRFWLESPWVQKFGKGLCSPDEFGTGVVLELDLPVTADKFVQAFISWDRGPMPGSKDLLNRLRKNYSLACLSNNNELHWGRIEKIGLDRYFDHLYISHLTGLVKPGIEAFEYVINDLGCPAEEILFFDDNQECINAAASVGMKSHKVNGVAEIKNILLKMNIE
jgi:putative hydrolase of the HAD superfamily